MSDVVRVALLQMRSGRDVRANLDAVAQAAEDAARDGARLLATPEGTSLLERDPAALIARLQSGEDEQAVIDLANIARRHGLWLLAGSLLVSAGDGRAANRSFLFAPDGRVAATYDKIHLFDVALGAGDTYAESRTVAPGSAARLAATPWGPLGLSICYDLRFAHLYRSLAQAGARLIAVPAAFTRPTGAAHWEMLLRARAIETGAFVLAPAQGGLHEDGRATWGRSMVIGPWGEVIAGFDHDEPGLLFADLHLSAVDAARTKLPSLAHDRPFTAPEPVTAEKVGAG